MRLPADLADSDGNKLTGANKYVLHFAKDQIPPVEAFWSVHPEKASRRWQTEAAGGPTGEVNVNTTRSVPQGAMAMRLCGGGVRGVCTEIRDHSR